MLQLLLILLCVHFLFLHLLPLLVSEEAELELRVSQVVYERLAFPCWVSAVFIGKAGCFVAITGVFCDRERLPTLERGK